jgi:hypothetical protein
VLIQSLGTGVILVKRAIEWPCFPRGGMPKRQASIQAMAKVRIYWEDGIEPHSESAHARVTRDSCSE